MSDVEDNESARPGRGKVVQRHKKELKELKDRAKKETARIKNKKDKREAEEKFKAEEEDLLKKHEEELAAYQQETAETDQAGDAAGTLNMENLSLYGSQPQEISKSQKKKNRKSEKEKQRREQIMKELGDDPSLGELENADIDAQLAEKNLKIHEIAADGNCLYRAFGHQLSLSEGGKAESFEEMRRLCAEFILKHKDEFLPYLDEESQTEEGLSEYCETIRSTTEWGGELEVRALSEALGRPVTIFSGKKNPEITYGEQFLKEGLAPLRLSYHRYLLSLGEHYNSVIPAS
uniref:OTU domain-containing protein n=1 Tax=Chromera velia CCMP2878 TaxID=1169474 RepID=A0A0G4FGL1_9ALVE|mmetsp:Transcript_21601/g.42964  ORF Transcript_21601/g.42964 Transcript_21601/m.42964 type:complete len:291 (+) Transcript_21601:85-957(+)|eukprot:Cvel_16890.t1-p1 / transcript=Cvel_16890.t1 / gene=Cvel_16890 / organism=Chromera_velia_CCMP2878 / gene_product=OTU domain-containing protein 6B, putative / transcript_product=OTU domain-containing protein 6B, putative / location=Cvel_scaffold1322:16842-17711(-) / protein_length=290 / sequence_SO=supercontig / SO=protein_coding / is_pseudo=false